MWNKTPDELEAWYRNDPDGFLRSFKEAPQDLPQAATWSARLMADGMRLTPRSSGGGVFPFAIAVSFGLAIALLIPYWMTGDVDFQWAAPLFATFALFPLLLFHGRKDYRVGGMALLGAVWVAAVYWWWEHLPTQWAVQSVLDGIPELEAAGERVNFVRQARDLMMIHWPMLLAGLTGLAFIRSHASEERVDFVRHALQVAILTGLVLAAGAALFGLTNLLLWTAEVSSDFKIKVNLHLGVWGASGALVFGHAVWRRHPQSLERILPTLARIFIPLFVLLEAGFLITHLSAGFEALQSDRDQLLIFNLLLAAVLGLVLLHAAFDEKVPRWTHGLMVALVILGVIADGMGMAAILGRLGEWGATPNRLAVLFGNLLLLCTLVALLWNLFWKRDSNPMHVIRRVLNQALAFFLLWSAVVTFLFPLACGVFLRSSDVSAIEQAEPRWTIEAEEPMEMDEEIIKE